MPKRYFNWKLAIVLLIGLVVLGVTAFGLRRWQRIGRAEEGLALGNKAYDEHRWEEAASNLGRYLGVNQNDVPILLKYADAHLKIRPPKGNNIQQAIGAYRIVLRVDKNNSQAAKQLTGLYLAMGMAGTMGMFGEAELIAERFLETNQDPELHRMFVAALAGQRKFDEAAAELKTIIAEHPDQVLAYEALGQLTEQRPESSPEQPEYWFNEAIKNNPSSALAYISRAAFHTRNRDRAKALADLEQAEKLDLSDPAVRLRLAAGFIYANALDKAEQHLIAVQKATPTELFLWQTWAQLALLSRSKEKMLTVAETALKELSSQPWDFMPTAAELFIRCGQLDRAADCISQLRQKDIDPSVVAFLDGLVADQKGQPSEAVKYWQRAIQLDNKSPRVPRVRLALASALARLGDTQSALWQLRIVTSENPSFTDAHLALANLLAQTGNWAETLEYAQRALQLSPGNLEANLLNLQAQMELLAASAATENAQDWQNIKNQLSALDKVTEGAPDVKLAQFRLAMHQRSFTEAETLLTQLKQSATTSLADSQLRIAMAEVDLLIAQEKVDEEISKLNEIVKQFPDSIEPVRVLAILLNQQKNREKCEATIKDALARTKQPIVYRELGVMLAELYTLWGQTDKLYPLLNELTQKEPNDIPIKRRLLVCNEVAKDPARVQQLIDNIKSLEGKEGWQWRYEQARAWFAAANFKDRYPQIISLLQENLLANPDDQASRLLLAAAYEKAGDLQKEYDQAEQILKRASQEKLSHPQLQRLKVAQIQLNLQQQKPQEAISLCNEIVNDLNNASAYILRARTFASLGQTDKAVEDLDYAIASEPNNIDAWVARSDFYYTTGQRDKAEADIQQALSLAPNSIQLQKRVVSLLLTSADPAKIRRAKSILDKALESNPQDNDTDTAILLANAYISTGEPQKAVSLLKNQLSICNPSTRRRCNLALAVALYKNANKTEAQKEFDSLLQSEPNDPAPLLAQAGVLKDGQLWSQINQNVTDWYQKHSKDIRTPISIARELAVVENSEAKKTAEEILKMVLNKDSNCTEAMSVLGMLLQMTGRSQESAGFYQQILALQPDNVTAINNLAWIMCEEQGKFQQALDLTERGLKISPNYIDLIDTRGVAYYRLGEFNKAIQDFTDCLKLYPGTAPSGAATRFHLARAFAALGEKDKAIEYLNQALNLQSQMGGLSTKDLAEAQRLLDELSKKGG